MKPYQKEYLELLRSAAQQVRPSADKLEPEAFVAATVETRRASLEAVRRGTELLRDNFFPVLGNIFEISPEEEADLTEFASELMRPGVGNDVELNYLIHQALLSRARRNGDRDGIIRELYYVGMALHSLEQMMSPVGMRLYSTRMRMCFTESASYFDTEYDDITDPEIRGYIHRSMSNIALGYTSSDPASSKAKLAVINRAIAILSDPDIRAKTPSLPWDTYLFKTHQECTSLLNFLRSGQAGPDAFARVLESAQIVQERQLNALRERGQPLQPRWQYAYYAARYHCGAMRLSELLDLLYGLSTTCEDTDMSSQSLFSHLGAPSYYMDYSRRLTSSGEADSVELRISRMTRRAFQWLVRYPSGDDELIMFHLKQFVYFYRDIPGGMPFYEVLQNALAARCPNLYARMWTASRIAAALTGWAVADCPEKLLSLGYTDAADVRERAGELERLARRAGTVYDAGMIHFVNFEASACRGILRDEEFILQLHAFCGARLLLSHPSTEDLAPVAEGHHCRYDGKGGYPMDFSILDSPMRPLIGIIAVADVLVSTVEETSSRFRPFIAFDSAVERLREGSGTLYAPFAVSLLTRERLEELRVKIDAWRRDAYLDMYRRRAALKNL